MFFHLSHEVENSTCSGPVLGKADRLENIAYSYGWRDEDEIDIKGLYYQSVRHQISGNQLKLPWLLLTGQVLGVCFFMVCLLQLVCIVTRYCYVSLVGQELYKLG